MRLILKVFPLTLDIKSALKPLLHNTSTRHILISIVNLSYLEHVCLSIWFVSKHMDFTSYPRTKADICAFICLHVIPSS